MVDKNESTMKWKVDITQLKSSMQEAKRAISLANAEFKTATAGLDKWSKSATGVEANLDRLNKILPQQRSILNDLKKQYELTAKEMGADSAEAQRLAIQVENQRAVVAKTEADIKKYGEQLKTMSEEGLEASKSTEKLSDKVKASAETFKKFGSVVSDIAVKGLTAFATAVTGAVASLTATSVSAGKYADDMITMSKVTGISTDALQAYNYASELVDVSLETLTGSMARNVKSMASAQKGSSAYADAYKKLGVAVTNADGSLRNSEEVYWEVIDALGGIENETERDAIAMQLFGKSARDLNPLILEGSEGIAKLTEEAQKMGAVLTSEQLETLGEFDDSLQRLKSGASSAKTALGLLLLPQLQELATTGTELLGQFTKGIIDANGDWTKISAVVGDTVNGISKAIMAELPKLFEVGAVIVKSLASAVLDSLPMLIDTAISMIMELVTGLVDNLPQIVSTGMDILDALVNGITEAIPNLIEMLPQIIWTIVKVLVQNLPRILEMGVEILMSIVNGINSVLGNLWTKVSEIASGIVSRLKGIINNTVSIGRDVVSGIWQGISGAYDWLKNKISEWVGNVTAFIKRLFGISSPSKVMADEVGKWLSEGIAVGFTDDLPQAISSMKGSLTDALDVLKSDVALTAGNLIGDVSLNGSTSGVGGGQIINFNQVINSPKAVDRLTLYRETNGLLFSAKVGMNNV